MRPNCRSKGLSAAFVLLLMLAGSLSNIYGQDDKKLALELVQQNLAGLQMSKSDLENLYVSDAHTDRLSGALMVYLQQQYKTINVHNAFYSIAFKDGKLMSANNTFVQKIQTRVNSEVPVVSPDAAVGFSARHLNIQPASTVRSSRVIEKGKFIEFDKGGISKKEIPVKLVWVVVNETSVRLAWEVHIDPVNTSDMWNVRIDASTGHVLDKDNWTRECRWDLPLHDEPSTATAKNKSWVIPYQRAISPSSPASLWSASAIPLTKTSNYLVIPYPIESPLHSNGMQTLHTDPWLLAGANNPAISYGWHHDGTNDYAYTRGNNVLAQEDMDRSNASLGYVASSATSFPGLNFQYALDFSKQPVVSDNILAGLTNLFYWNNIMHDISYQYGFDEAAGNFQKDNMGRGGQGNDFVLAEAQDATDLNNANFNTPPDGQSPRMQMFLWDRKKRFIVNEPASLAGVYTFAELSLSPNYRIGFTGSKTGNIVLFSDTGSTYLGCTPGYNPQLAGNIALIDRGSCSYFVKVKNAQNAGAIAAIIINTGVGPGVPATNITDTSIKIPSVQLSLADGMALKNAYLNGITVNITLSAGINIDGDLDNGIIAHEYTHGISNRLTAGRGAASCLNNNEQMGEGWSDYYGLMVTTDWSKAQLSDGPTRRGIGNYALNLDITGPGIRQYPYSTNMAVNPFTYRNVGTVAIPHGVGSIWCTVLWDMTWAMIEADGAINPNLYNPHGNGGNSAALKLVTMGLKLQPCSPGFIDGRNAILKADSILFNGKYSCVIWKAFARRGLGMRASQGSSFAVSDEVEDFSIPNGATLRKSVDKHAAGTGDFINYNLAIECQCAPLTGLTIRDTLSGNVIYQTGGTPNGTEVSFSSIDLTEQQTAYFNVSVQLNERYVAPFNLLNETVISPVVNPAIWTRTATIGQSQWVPSSTVFNSQPYSFLAPDSSASTDFSLVSTNSYLIGRVSSLSFWHYYNVEYSWDGGVVELSTDNGLSWIDAGQYMTLNGYSTTIRSSAGTSISGRKAFTGLSGSTLIQTVIDLSSFTGQSLKFRFRFVTDFAGAGLGWFVDDILLRAESGTVNTAYLYRNDSLLSKSTARTLILNRGPLQTTFEDFYAVKENDNGLISWLTSNDFNSRMFDVEKSVDGVNFYNIGTVMTAGTGEIRNKYQFTDDQLVKGTNYYRLKQTGMDGKVSYTEIKSIQVEEAIVAFSVTPNPSPGLLRVSLPPSNTKIPLSVFDSKGRLVFKEALNAGNQKLNLSHLVKGVYILQFNLNDKTVIRKIVLQ